MTDLQRIWSISRETLRPADFETLISAGVPHDITGTLPRDGGLALGAHDIAIKQGRWESRFRGERAIILPVWGVDEEKADEDIFVREAEWALGVHESCRETLLKFQAKCTAPKLEIQAEAVLIKNQQLIEAAYRRCERERERAAHAVIDLIAFRPDIPRSFWSLSGAGFLLGYENLERAEYMAEPLFVHESPLEWLRADCQGIVILNWEHYSPMYFAGLPALRVRDLEFGRRLTARLERPLPIPDVQVAL